MRSESTAVEVFKCNDVKIFQIKADGTVTSHTIEPELSVVKITGNLKSLQKASLIAFEKYIYEIVKIRKYYMQMTLSESTS